MSRLAHNFFKVGCPRTCNFFKKLLCGRVTVRHRIGLHIYRVPVIHFKMQRVAVAILFVLGLHAASAGLLTPVVGLLTPPSTPSTPSTPTMGTGSGAADPQVVDFSGRHFEFIGELACIFILIRWGCVSNHTHRDRFRQCCFRRCCLPPFQRPRRAGLSSTVHRRERSRRMNLATQQQTG